MPASPAGEHYWNNPPPSTQNPRPGNPHDPNPATDVNFSVEFFRQQPTLGRMMTKQRVPHPTGQYR